MKRAPKQAVVNVHIPQDIKAVFNAYGFGKNTKLEDAIAVRQAPYWFAILFKRGKELFAVDFQLHDDDKWEISNDYIDMDSVEQFTTTKLIQTFF